MDELRQATRQDDGSGEPDDLAEADCTSPSPLDGDDGYRCSSPASPVVGRRSSSSSYMAGSPVSEALEGTGPLSVLCLDEASASPAVLLAHSEQGDERGRRKRRCRLRSLREVTIIDD